MSRKFDIQALKIMCQGFGLLLLRYYKLLKIAKKGCSCYTYHVKSFVLMHTKHKGAVFSFTTLFAQNEGDSYLLWII